MQSRSFPGRVTSRSPCDVCSISPLRGSKHDEEHFLRLECSVSTAHDLATNATTDHLIRKKLQDFCSLRPMHFLILIGGRIGKNMCGLAIHDFCLWRKCDLN